ncbi:hypothetical protein EDC04DRAFT_1080980 [Pisolithus marmoratus]|nr:hypothetical protein EDC04DRAFT_1080980 [Pisolithus marmoratus]
MSSEPVNSAVMYELYRAREVLAALEKQEQDLLDQLRDVQSATQAQKAEVEEFIRQLPSAPISRLPNELLIRIFKLSLGAALVADHARAPDRQLSWMQGLAGVSRHWRDVVLNSPTLWTTILVTPYSWKAPVEVHLHRSSQLAIDIEFHSWDSFHFIHQDLLKNFLTMLIPHAHRWRSFSISDHINEMYLSAILVRLQRVTFPSLTRVSIHDLPVPFADSQFEHLSLPVFLRPGTCPRLKYLRLINPDIVDTEEFRVPPSVTRVTVEFDYDLSSEEQPWIPSFLDSLSCLQLTTLTLAGGFDISEYHFPPNSIQLPLLEKFVCRVTNTRALVQAIAAPSLSHTECYPNTLGYPFQNNFTGLESKFACVHRLILVDFHPVLLGWDSSETKEICLAFPNIRHLIFTNPNAVMMLHPDVAVYWQHLESLTIHTTAENSSGFLHGLLPWLKRRLDMKSPMIRLTFKGSMNVPTMSSLYEALHEFAFWSGRTLYTILKSRSAGPSVADHG